MIRNVETNLNGTVFNRMRQYRAYTDDVLILGRLVRAIEVVVTQMKEAAISTGLVINESKTKYLKINRNIKHLEQDLIMDGQIFEWVLNFRYFATMINSKNVISDEIKSRIAAGNRHFYNLRQIGRSRTKNKALALTLLTWRIW